MSWDKPQCIWLCERVNIQQFGWETVQFGDIHGLTIKFANSPPCTCRDSSGQKPWYGLMTSVYQCFTAVLLLIYGSLFLSGVYYCLSVLVCRRENVGAWIKALAVREFLASKQIGTPSLFTGSSPQWLFLLPKINKILKGRHFDGTDDRSNTTAAVKAIP
jgi:hypothetical protein